MASVEKRVAWVTGGGSGIGQAGAESLAADCWTVVISGRRRDVLDVVVKGIRDKDGTADALSLDVSDARAAMAAAEHIVANHGRIDLWSTVPGSTLRSVAGRTSKSRAGTKLSMST